MLPRTTRESPMAVVSNLRLRPQLKRKSRPHCCPRYLHAVADAVHPLGVLAGTDPLAVAPDVHYFSAPRSSGLGGWQGEQGRDVPVGTKVPLGTEKKKKAMRVLLQPRHQTGPWMLGKLRHTYPSSVRHLKQREKVKTQPPVSLKVGPF